LNKISLIIKREYLTRVKKKSFVIMTLIGPLLMAGLMLVPIWLALKDQDIQYIEVIDETGQFINQFENSTTLNFNYKFININEAKKSFYDEKYTSILHIYSTDKNSEAEIYYKKQPGITTISKIESTIEKGIKNIQLKQKFGISKEQLDDINPKVTVKPISLGIKGEEESKDVEISTAIGFGGAILIYFFIFMYGMQIMRGVIEEKTSRIVEIIISSVKPFQLMMGKILGIALVGLTQFILWIVLTVGIYTAIMQSFSNEKLKQITQNEQMINGENMPQNIKNIQNIKSDSFNNIKSTIQQIPITKIIVSFIFYFMGGYLLYGALLAAVGSAVDSESDTQQFMLPITIPLIFSFVVAQTVMQNPDGTLAFWLSIIPLTSPVIMMVRIPFGVDTWQILLSMFLLILGFVATTWMAAKIYRTGILMYGKKVNYKELWKWLTYKG